MRLIELHVENLRGIRSIDLHLDGRNLVVVGPNGSGKSAVIDAIEFALTGSISRLKGAGAGTLSLKDHGPHVDYRDKLKDVVVRAKFVLPDGQEAAIERKMSSPTKPTITPTNAAPLLMKCLQTAATGQHVLSRREILQYITAEAGKRALGIQTLLRLEDIEQVRRTLVAVKNGAERKVNQKKTVLRNAESSICRPLNLQTFSEPFALARANESRHVLGGVDVAELCAASLKESLQPRAAEAACSKVNVQTVSTSVASLRTKANRWRDLVAAKVDRLGQLLMEVCADAVLRMNIRHQRLVELGLSLLGDDDRCPLCGTQWDAAELRRILEEREKSARASSPKVSELQKVATLLRTEADTLRAELRDLRRAATDLQIGESAATKQLADTIDAWSTCLDSPMDNFGTPAWPSRELSALLPSDSLETGLLGPLESAIRPYLEVRTPQDNAWDTLTQLEVLLNQLEDARDRYNAATVFQAKADAVHAHFESARDAALEATYDAIAGDFSDYYRAVHANDESAFKSKLTPSGPALDFQVDFYGRGLFPPHALHSEGHQDCMGVCLYLALNKYLNAGLLDLIVLDDVVMSIDTGHRRRLCGLLRDQFHNRQLVITTHDRVWAKQLKTEAIVDAQHLVRFSGWTVDAGPYYESDPNLWQSIASDLSRDDVPKAAWRLRREAEGFFEEACERLRARVVYAGDGHYTLGDFAPAAASMYKALLKKAKATAQSWKQTGMFDKLDMLDKESSAVLALCQVEQWSVNASVHYDRWTHLGKQDFEPIVNSFKRLFELFQCGTCHEMLYVITPGAEPVAVKCACGATTWNLSSREVG